MTDKRARFADLHIGPDAFIMPGPYDAGSAKLLTQMGFMALSTSSSAASFALGRRDGAWTVDRGEMFGHIGPIVEATALPVSADLDSGFGDLPEDVAETVSQAIAIGCAGGSIGDATGVADRPFYDIELASARIRAARDAIDDIGVPFVVTAGTGILGRGDGGGLEEGIRRLKSYAASGADCVYMPGLARRRDIERVVNEVGAPLDVLAGLGDRPLTVAELRAAGVRRISLGPHLVRRALGALVEASREILEEGTFSFAADQGGFAEFGAAFAPQKDD